MSPGGAFPDPAILVILALLGLAFVRFAVWWMILKPIFALLLRPAGLLVLAAAVLAVVKLG